MNTHENLLNVPSPYGGSFFTTTTVPYGGMPNSPFTKVRQPETTSSKNLFYDKAGGDYFSSQFCQVIFIGVPHPFYDPMNFEAFENPGNSATAFIGKVGAD